MNITIENIVFVTPTTGIGQQLAAVFDVNFGDDHLGPSFSVRVNGFRYFDNPVSVAEPAIKTDRGFIRPVRATEEIRNLILKEFNAAWDLLVIRRST